jgi:radical SAM protein with 4Fe4S-binding SPASM domain
MACEKGAKIAYVVAMFPILQDRAIANQASHSSRALERASSRVLEPPNQSPRFERIADWLFVRRQRDHFLLIRSYPFNVVKIASAELEGIRAYIGGNGEISASFHAFLAAHHFFDPEPSSTALTRHTSAILLVTTACNLACDGCFASGGDYGLGANHMSPSVIDATIRYLTHQLRLLYETDGFKGHSNLGVHFFGGEPFIAFDRIQYAVERAEGAATNLTQECGVSISPDFFVTTNGTLSSPERVRFLRDHRFAVLLSIDGPSHDERRKYVSGRGSLRKAIDMFRSLRSEGIRTRLNTVVLGEDVPKFQTILDWFQTEVYSHCPDLSVYHTFSFQRDGPGFPIGECKTPYSTENIDAYIGDLAEFNRQGYQLYETVIRKKLASGGTFYKCSSGVKRIAIAPDGGVFPCQGFIDPTFKMGSILDDGFQHRLTSISMQFAARNIATLEPCRNCVFSGLCPHNVDCAARAYYTLGGINVIDVNGMCRVGFELMDKILFEGDGTCHEARS